MNFKKAFNNNSTKFIIKKTPYIISNRIENTGVVKHGFSTRLGGVSEGIFSSLNLSFTRGDEFERVMKNHELISESIGFNYKDIVTSKQTHTTNIKVVKLEDKGKGIIKDRDYTDIDGFITNIPGIPIATYYADCVPLFFVDPVNKAIGLSHSGWKGTVNGIGKVTVELMIKEYNSNPENIIAFIGPSICKECYEVGKELYDEFKNNYTKDELECLFYKKENGKYLLDLWKANQFNLLNVGIKKYNIETTDICTCCNPELLFSHRASNGERGNLAAFLMLK